MENNQLLECISKVSSNRIAVLLRHPIRAEPDRHKDYYNIPLAPEGRKMAIEFGKKLPRDKLVRIFHSPIPRCRETAEYIKKGIISSTGTAVLMGEKDFLSAQFIINPKDMINMIEKMGISNFARKWLNRELDKKIMEDPYKVISNMLNGVLYFMQEDSDVRHAIDVHVTHDWNILPIKDILLNIKHEDVGWPDYLDGIILTSDSNDKKITLRWKDVAKKVHWEIGCKIVLKGIPASPGMVRGNVRIISSLNDIGYMRVGEVLVTSETNPQYLPALIKSIAIITDRGGILSHPAIVARELGVPGVVGTSIATKILQTGDYIVVDGDNGFIFQCVGGE